MVRNVFQGCPARFRPVSGRFCGMSILTQDSVLSKPHCIGTKVFRINVPHEHYFI